MVQIYRNPITFMLRSFGHPTPKEDRQDVLRDMYVLHRRVFESIVKSNEDIMSMNMKEFNKIIHKMGA